ncbi:MAG: hypothetical protein KDA52_15495 [Planctomycetaceae bacterium]|nr:hypothetical protein [Planctomycetaceae bacterium]
MFPHPEKLIRFRRLVRTEVNDANTLLPLMLDPSPPESANTIGRNLVTDRIITTAHHLGKSAFDKMLESLNPG